MKKRYQVLCHMLFFIALLLHALSVQAQWTTATLSQPRSSAGATSAGGKVFFAGGSPGPSSVVDIYDTATNTWSIASLSQPRSVLGATSMGSKVFFAGGSANSSASNVVDIYDTATNTWTTASLSQARIGVGATNAGGKAFFAGGHTITADILAVVDIYDTATNTWTTSSLSQARREVAATSNGSKVFFGGGYTGSVVSNVVDIFDTATNTWTTASLSQARSSFSATSLGDNVFFAGGSGNAGFSAVVDIYNTATNTWSTASLSQARTYLSATSAGGRAFFAGGAAGASPSNVVDIYSATIPTLITQGPTPTNQTLCEGGMASTTVMATGQNLTYQWYRNQATTDEPVSGQSTATLSLTNVTGAQAGAYYLKVSGEGGVVWSSAFNLNVMELSINATTNVTCNGGRNGSATVSVSGGAPPYTYSWSPSGGVAATASGLSAGIYTVTVTDGSGVYCSRSVTITQPTAFTFTPTQTNVTCFGGSDGTASATVTGGSGSYTYAWYSDHLISSGPNSISGLTAGGYSFIVTDAITGCSTTLPFYLPPPPAVLPVITSGGPTTFCAGGSVNLSTTGSFSSYVWQKGNESVSTDPTYTATSSGTYTVMVTNANGCSGTSSPILVTVTPLPNAAFSGLAGPYCADAPSVSLTPTTAGGSFAGAGVSGTLFTPSTAGAGGPYSISYTVSQQGCANTSSQLVTVLAKPAPPSLLTQSGQLYSGGQTSVSVPQYSGTVTLVTSGCPVNGSVTWRGPNNSTGTGTIISVSTTTTGTFIYSATCQVGGCTSAPASATVVVHTAPLQMEAPLYDCATGQITLRTSGGNGQALEYSIVGVTNGFSSQSSYVLDAKVRQKGKDLTLEARQPQADGKGWVRTQLTFTPSNCPASARLAASEPVTGLLVTVLGNPLMSTQLEVEVRGAAGLPLQFQVMDLSGRVITQQFVEVAGVVETQRLEIGAQSAGMLLLRVSTPTQQQVLKVVKP